MKTFVDYKNYDIVRRPIVTEKAYGVQEKGQYFFVVQSTANKSDIKKAVENLFDVKVKSVNTLIKKGKKKVFRGRVGKQSDIKKAMVTLESGYNIDLTGGA